MENPLVGELTDAQLLEAFNSADSVLDGLHEVATLIVRALPPQAEYDATVTLLRKLVDYQHTKNTSLQTASTQAASEPTGAICEDCNDAVRYRRLIASGEFVPSIFGGWAPRALTEKPATKEELDFALDNENAPASVAARIWQGNPV